MAKSTSRNSKVFDPNAPGGDAGERRLFGTDGIRGVANEPPMTPEIAFKVGCAIAHVARRNGRPAKVLVGKDTRLSGYMLETALASGVCAMGGRVLLCGPIPTPAIAYLTNSMRADAGVAITASHNPFEDNGIKLFGADGFKFPDEKELAIERMMSDGTLDRERPTAEHIGRAERVEAAGGRYVTNVKSTFPRDLRLDGIKIVVDAANGAAYKVAPLVFTELGADVIALGVKPTGRNINKGCGALHPQAMREVVLARGAAIGIALDGDADRLIVVDEAGEVVDGDVIMALCATRMMKRGELRNGGLVATVMSNLGLERAIDDIGAKLIRTPVGDRYVVEAMRSGGYSFGGEQSGHLIFLDHASTGDGLVAGLQLLSIMVREGRPLSELARAAMSRVPQVLEAVTLKARRPIDAMETLSKAITAHKEALGREGRILVRWSGTEPKLRVMVEGPEEGRIKQIALELCDAARRDADVTARA
ncbi:MAG: phosphoglucosamine mutase [Deltaproteobacteria bacterium]|nr:phosphoglucosamine mutase [Deltaproteobacteria bacterium]